MMLGAAALALPTPSFAEGIPVFQPRPRLETRAIDPCPGPLCGRDFPGPTTPTAQGLRIVYLNFEGVILTASNSNDDARNNVSAILAGAVAPGQSRTIPQFQPSHLGGSTGGLSRAQIINRVVQDMYAIHAPYNIEFVTTRPTSGTYHMVVFGGNCSTIAGQGGCAGIALQDCGDFLPNNIVFVFPGSLRLADMATTAAQEGAHAFGLTHTLDQADVMYPTIQSSIPSGFGAGQVPSNDQPTSCTAATFQDSDQMMMDTIGFRGQDTIPPAVNLTAPASGSPIVPGSTQVVATATDNSVVTQVEFVVNSVVQETRTAPPYSFVVPATTPPGDTILSIRATDDSGNVGADRVIVYAVSGDEQPCDTDDECPDGLECNQNLCVPDNGIDGELGDICVTNDDCIEGACATLSDESRCSVPCDDATPCPGGFDCRGGVACWPAEGDGGGCSVGGGSSSGLAGGLLLSLGLLLMRRRRVQ